MKHIKLLLVIGATILTMWRTQQLHAWFSYAVYHPTLRDLLEIEKVQEKIKDTLSDNPQQVFFLQKKITQLQTTHISPQTQRYLERIQHIIQDWLLVAFIANFDYHSDNSITKFVWKNIWYNTREYTPQHLVRIEESESINLIKRYQWIEYYIEASAYSPLQDMAKEFYKTFNTPLTIFSAYRSYERQQEIYATCPHVNTCAKPWFSEHQSWLAVDIWWLIEHSQFYQRMVDNAHLYWFHQSYQWDDIYNDYEEEKRHWRFIGRTLATYLHEQNISLAQRYYAIHRE